MTRRCAGDAAGGAPVRGAGAAAGFGGSLSFDMTASRAGAGRPIYTSGARRVVPHVHPRTGACAGTQPGAHPLRRHLRNLRAGTVCAPRSAQAARGVPVCDAAERPSVAMPRAWAIAAQRRAAPGLLIRSGTVRPIGTARPFHRGRAGAQAARAW